MEGNQKDEETLQKEEGEVCSLLKITWVCYLRLVDELLPTTLELGYRNPVFRGLLKQTVRSSGSLGFSQAAHFRGVRIILGAWPRAVRNYNRVLLSSL